VSFSPKLLVAVVLFSTASACGTGRVRVGQATEIKQEEVYEPKSKVEPPEASSERRPEAYPILEVDIERKKGPYQPDADPEPE